METKFCTLTQLRGMCWKENRLHFISILLKWESYTLITTYFFNILLCILFQSSFLSKSMFYKETYLWRFDKFFS